MWAHTRETQAVIRPQDALELLREGNLRFQHNLKADRNLLKQVNQTSDGQYPFAAILSCIDSRTSAELIFDQGLGDIFSLRIAGNVLNDDILGSMEYACQVAGSKIVLVLGHTKCSAVISACQGLSLGHLDGLLAKIRPSVEAETVRSGPFDGQDLVFVNRVSLEHVRWTLAEIRRRSDILRTLELQGDILLAGGLYDLDTGVVTFGV